MIDRGRVVNIKDGIAAVEITSLSSQCEHCSAQSLCLSSSSPGVKLLTVQNPIKATVGDLVEIEIPESKYQSTLIFIFGSLLGAIILGIGLGYGLSLLWSLSPPLITLITLTIALLATALWIKIKLNKRNQEILWPIIVKILAKGVANG